MEEKDESRKIVMNNVQMLRPQFRPAHLGRPQSFSTCNDFTHVTHVTHAPAAQLGAVVSWVKVFVLCPEVLSS